jgi:hypothetical protein
VEGNLALFLDLFLFGRTLVVTLKLTNNDGNETTIEKKLATDKLKISKKKKKSGLILFVF